MMQSSTIPYFLQEYCEHLNDSEWQYFYKQMLEPIAFITDTSYLFHVLQWILKCDFEDLSYDVFFQYMLDPECPSSMINNEWWLKLWDRYGEQVKKEMQEIHCGHIIETDTNIIDSDEIIF